MKKNLRIIYVNASFLSRLKTIEGNEYYAKRFKG